MKTGTIKDWSRLSEARLLEANKVVLIKAKDRLRKYNKRYGTNYKIDMKTIDLHDPNLHERLELITTQNIKTSKPEEMKMPLVEKYEVNGIRLSKEEFEEMKKLQKKANRIRGKRQDGSDYYTPYFKTKKGYERYMEVLRGMQTRQQYLSHMTWQLQTFRENVLNHLDDLAKLAEDADKKAEIEGLFEWIQTACNTYTRLDQLYKYLIKNGFTGEQIARLFFDSDPKKNRFQGGEDEEFIELLKQFKASKGWTKGGRLTQLEEDQPLEVA